MNLEEEISTETSPIEEPEPSTDIDLSEEKKRVDELPKIYPSRVLFSSALEASSSTLELPSPSELKLSLITLENTCLKSKDTLPVPISSNLVPNPKTQFMSILEEQIGEILNKQGSVNGFVNYLSKIKNRDMKYFLKIGNKLLKFIIGHLSKIGNPKSLEFINPIFDTG